MKSIPYEMSLTVHPSAWFLLHAQSVLTCFAFLLKNIDEHSNFAEAPPASAAPLRFASANFAQ